MGLVRVGTVYLDGTKLKANASRHKALSYDYMKRLEQELESEISKLLELATSTDEREQSLPLDLPAELQRREDRLQKIRQAKAVVEARAAERYSQQKQEFDQKMSERSLKESQTGKKSPGRVPQPPDAAPGPSDQYNFTDPQSRIMKTSCGFEQCYNAQAAVNEDMLILGAYSNAQGNDPAEFLGGLASIPVAVGTPTVAVADAGYFSESNVLQAPPTLVPLIATAREPHNSYPKTVLNPQTPGLDFPLADGQTLSAIEIMRIRLKIPEYRAIYRKRKQTVEPVFGIIKEVLGFRRFSLRGLSQTDGNGHWCAWLTISNAYSSCP